MNEKVPVGLCQSQDCECCKAKTTRPPLTWQSGWQWQPCKVQTPQRRIPTYSLPQQPPLSASFYDSASSEYRDNHIRARKAVHTLWGDIHDSGESRAEMEPFHQRRISRAGDVAPQSSAYLACMTPGFDPRHHHKNSNNEKRIFKVYQHWTKHEPFSVWAMWAYTGFMAQTGPVRFPVCEESQAGPISGSEGRPDEKTTFSSWWFKHGHWLRNK